MSDSLEKSTKIKKNKSKVVLELEEQEEEQKEEIITIDDIKYIKEGLDIYRIKSGIKYKLYGQMNLKTGKVTKIKISKSEN